MSDVQAQWDGCLALLRSGRELVAADPSKDILRSVGVLPWRVEHEWSREAMHLICRAVGRSQAPYDDIWVTHFNTTESHQDRLGLFDKAIALGEADRDAGRKPVAWRVVGNSWALK